MSRHLTFNHTLTVSLLSSIILLGCGGSSGSSTGAIENNASANILEDIIDDNIDLNTDDEDESIFGGLLGTQDELAISFTTLDALPPLQERLYGGSEFVSIVTGDVIGTGEVLNSDMMLDIPFTIEEDVTEGLIIEKLYVTRNYVRRGTSIDGEIFEDGARSRLDMAQPLVFAVITNLSNVDICNVALSGPNNLSRSIIATMRQGGTVRADNALHGSGVSYTNIRREFAQTCVSAFSSIYMSTAFNVDRFSAFNDGDDFADIEDIESISILNLTGFTTEATPLETGLVTLNYMPQLNVFGDFNGNYEKTFVNQSDTTLESKDGDGFILDPETMLPIAQFSNDFLRTEPTRPGYFAPGDEVTSFTGNDTGDFKQLTIDRTPGSSNVLMFVNRFLPVTE